MDSPVHAVAVLKGVVEGDTFRHLGSLLGLGFHAGTLLRLGLAQAWNGSTYEVTPNDAGREFYVRYCLDLLPDGRAKNWGDAADGAVAALRELEAGR